MTICASHSRKGPWLRHPTAAGREELLDRLTHLTVGPVTHIPMPKVEGSLPHVTTPRRFIEEPLQWDVYHVPTIRDMVKFLIRQEQVTSGFQNFIDRPQSHCCALLERSN